MAATTEPIDPTTKLVATDRRRVRQGRGEQEQKCSGSRRAPQPHAELPDVELARTVKSTRAT